jgi:hypothetical protein
VTLPDFLLFSLQANKTIYSKYRRQAVNGPKKTPFSVRRDIA